MFKVSFRKLQLSMKYLRKQLNLYVKNHRFLPDSKIYIIISSNILVTKIVHVSYYIHMNILFYRTFNLWMCEHTRNKNIYNSCTRIFGYNNCIKFLILQRINFLLRRKHLSYWHSILQGRGCSILFQMFYAAIFKAR